MSVFPDKDRYGNYTGRWCVDVQVKGERFKYAADSMSEAEAWEGHVKEHGKAPELDQGPTFTEVAHLCIAAGGPRGVWIDGRDKSMQSRLAFVMGQHLGGMPIRAIGTEDINDFVRDLRARPVLVAGRDGEKKVRTKPRKQSTINRYLDAISAVFTYAYEHTPRIVDHKPKMPKVREVQTRFETLEVEQEAETYRQLTERGQPEMVTSVQFLIATGLRRGEFEKIGPLQIRDDEVIIYAHQAKNNRQRNVFLPRELAREMRDLIATGRRPRAYLLARTLKRIWEIAGYPSELCVHSLRHTFVTRLIDAGVDISDVQELAGHSSILTTKRYAHSNNDRKRRAAQKLSGTAGDFGLKRSA